MSQNKATVIADSKNEFNNRITTIIATFPRFLLAELNTHRALSRNSASSRAIRFEKMVQSVQENSFIPIAWQKDHPGMQGTEYFTEQENIDNCYMSWVDSAEDAIERATILHDLGVTKQLANRLLEPFMMHTALITATEWENFLALRCPQYSPFEDGSEVFASKKACIEAVGDRLPGLKDMTDLEWLYMNKGTAEIHFMDLAEKIFDALNESTPNQLEADEWHIPFYKPEEEEFILGERDRGNPLFVDRHIRDIMVSLSTVRCARISYLTQDKKTFDYEADLKLHDRLLASGHWSAFEHCAQVMTEEEYYNHGILTPGQLTYPDGKVEICEGALQEGWCGNFRGFIQYRKKFENENRTEPQLIKK